MRRAATALLLAGTAAFGFGGARAVAGTPPGASARCVDGSYSYSLTHSGTCSHHGGVAAWLDARTGTAAAAAPSEADGTLHIGPTVLLAARTAGSGCTRGPRPDRRCSPGAYSKGLTASVICASAFRTSSVRNVPQAEKYAVEREYGMQARLYGRSIEIDHIVSLELGGSNDIANLFPEPGSGPADYRDKDRLENRLHDMVCEGRIGLRAAQAQIAGDWRALYARTFGAPPP